MSYTVVPTSMSRSSSPSDSSGSSARRSSEFPLLPTSSSHDEHSKEIDDMEEAAFAWSQKKQEDGSRRKSLRLVVLAVPALLALLGLAFVANEQDTLPVKKVSGWVAGHFKTKAETATLLVPRIAENGTQFSYYPDPLTNPVSPHNRLDFGGSCFFLAASRAG